MSAHSARQSDVLGRQGEDEESLQDADVGGGVTLHIKAWSDLSCPEVLRYGLPANTQHPLSILRTCTERVVQVTPDLTVWTSRSGAKRIYQLSDLGMIIRNNGLVDRKDCRHRWVQSIGSFPIDGRNKFGEQGVVGRWVWIYFQQVNTQYKPIDRLETINNYEEVWMEPVWESESKYNLAT